MRTGKRPCCAKPREPGASTETCARKLYRNRGAAAGPNPAPLHWMQPAQGRLAHIGWACAYLWDQVAPRWTRPQIRPWNGWWTEDERRRQSDPGACQTASALRSLRNLY